MKKNNQITGNIGLYYVSYLLSKLNWNVLITARNAAGIDMVAYNQDCSTKIGIQIKTISNHNAVPISNGAKKLIGDFLIICCITKSDPEVYCYSIDKNLIDLIHTDKDGSSWFESKVYRNPEHLNNLEMLLGNGDK